jgi:PhnB protein
MVKVNPYITFMGNCEEAFNFYRQVFGGDFQFIGRYKDIPSADRQNFKDADDKIMHVSLPISKETILMGCDSPDETVLGNNISLSIDTDSRDEADRIFTSLSDRGQIKMAMNETFWGAYFGMLEDRFGIQWLINCDIKKA